MKLLGTNRAIVMVLSIFFLLGSASILQARDAKVRRSGIEMDRYGNEVVNSSGEKRNFPQELLTGDDSTPMAADKGSASIFSSGTSTGVPLMSTLSVPDDITTLKLEQVWNYRVWGTSIGRSGMIPVDLDGNGDIEIVLGNSPGGFSDNNAWSVVKYDSASGGYRIAWASPLYDTTVTRIEVIQVNGSTKIFVGLGNGALLVYDGPTLKLEKTQQITTGGITAIILTDCDNDDEQELAVVSETDTTLVDPESLLEQNRFNYGGLDAVVGNVDQDGHLEMVFSGGQVITILNDTATMKWDFGLFGQGRYLALSDIDGDGMQEIISARTWDYIDIFDGDAQSPKFQINTDLDIHALLLADTNGDGHDEIIYGDAQWGSIHVLDAATGTELWNIKNPEHGTTNIALADVDGDNELEIMWGGGWTSTGEDYFFVGNIGSKTIEFQSKDLVGPFAALTVGDPDDDGTPEIVAISFESDSGYGDGVVNVFDATTFSLEWQSNGNLFNRNAWTGIHDVKIGDVDGDGDSEIVVATDKLYDGAIYVIDGKSHQIENQYLYDSGSPLYALALADMTNDGRPEIVASAGREHTGSPGTYLYVIDGSDGSVLWKTVSLSTGWEDTFAIEAQDLDADTIRDVIVSLNKLIVVDGAGHTIRISTETGYRGISTADLDENGSMEIWAGTTSGNLVKIDPADLTPLESWPVCATSVNSVKINQADSMQGVVQIVCDDQALIFDPERGLKLWVSEPLPDQAGLANNLASFDIDNQNVMVVGHKLGVSAFMGYGTGDVDMDDDGVLNTADNCVLVPNPDQHDSDGDGIGDKCNDSQDSDGDEWNDRLDNCPESSNADQKDTDGNGVGDVCNDSEDSDGDEWADDIDNCLSVANSDQSNIDGDTLGDVCDPYPENPDNYAARCEEAIVNESQYLEQLNICIEQSNSGDEDNDGEIDRNDECPDTSPNVPVDQAGCSIDQFCSRYENNSRGCRSADWKNDEPLTNAPDDCTPQYANNGFLGYLSGESICVPK